MCSCSRGRWAQPRCRSEWDRGSRRLSGSLDHLNPKSWTGCVDTRKVNVAQCWTAGLAAAKQMLNETNLFDPYDDLDFNAIQRKEKDTTMLRPKGVRVGTQLPADASGGGG